MPVWSVPIRNVSRTSGKEKWASCPVKWSVGSGQHR